MKTDESTRSLPAEWEAQDAVMLAWPHEQTDWLERLGEAQQTFAEIIRAISRFEPVLLIVPNKTQVLQQLQAANIDFDQVRLYELPSNDTWSRDFGPLTVRTDQGLKLLDFVFNGWGHKFHADLDNQLSAKLLAAGAFGVTSFVSSELVLEGGSIESDGSGTLLTTRDCLLEKNRNPHLSPGQIEEKLKFLFGAEQILWLEHGALKGDDTDSHIDTLARFAPESTIIFQGCSDPTDEHYPELSAMHEQLASFTDSTGNNYRLLELPWPQACYDNQGNRLPATYANFLIINGAVLVPTYNDPADPVALEVVAQAFPQREIVPVDCRALIEQHGSLHCVTMQLPKGVLA